MLQTLYGRYFSMRQSAIGIRDESRGLPVDRVKDAQRTASLHAGRLRAMTPVVIGSFTTRASIL